MLNKKISALTALNTTPDVNDVFPLVNSSTTKKATLGQLASFILSLQSQTLDMTSLTPGENVFTHRLGKRPSHISFWWYNSDTEETVLLQPFDVITKDDDDPNNKIFVINPDSTNRDNIIIELSL